MRRRMYIPTEVQGAIAEHVSAAVAEARDGFYSASEDEDTLTGHLGGLLRVGPQHVTVDSPEVAQHWTWKITYTKFRSRGRGAAETTLGADGIFELQLSIGGRIETKTLLFQSKIGTRGGKRLVEQALKLSTWREAAVVITYAPQAFNAFSIDETLSARGDLRKASAIPLDACLNELFVSCALGDDELYYDASRRILTWREMDGEIVGTRFRVTHRVAFAISAEDVTPNRYVDRFVAPDDAGQYRMYATDAELLTTVEGGPVSPQQGRKVLLPIYHPDRYAGYDALFQDIANKRSQDINSAYDRVRAGKPRR